MSKRVRAHKIAAKYDGDMARYFGNDADLYIGDADTTRAATGMLAELLSKGGAYAADKQAENAAKAKSDEDKKKQDIADKDKNAALTDWKNKQKAQVDAQADAHAAQLRAQTEATPDGPLHKAAKQAADKAALAAADTAAAADKLAFYTGGATPGSPDAAALARLSRNSSWWEEVPTWAKIAGGVLGAGLVVGVGYKILRRK